MPVKSMTSTVASADRAAPAVAGQRRALRWTLAGLTTVVGIAAIWGGVLLMTDSWRMPAGWLAATPFHSWFLPGLALLILIGGSQLTAAFALLSHRPWQRMAAIAAGLILIGWIAVQLAVLRRYHPMQPTMVLFGALTATLAWWLPGRPRR